MRILLMSSAYNSLTQRVHSELADRGHEVSVELALGEEVMRDGVRRYRPGPGHRADADHSDSRGHLVGPAVLHRPPGPPGRPRPVLTGLGDHGAAPGAGVSPCCRRTRRWTPATSGPAWSSRCRGCSKSSVYRTEVADAAVEAVLLAVARFAGGGYRPEPLDYSRPGVTGQRAVRRAGRPTAGSTGRPSPRPRCWPSCGRPTPAPASWT